MKEFWHKHKKLILISGGLLILFYLIYRYQKNQAANAANQNAANQGALAAQYASAAYPYLVGGGGSSNLAGSQGSTIPLQNFTGTPTPATTDTGTTTQPSSPTNPTPSSTPAFSPQTGLGNPAPTTSDVYGGNTSGSPFLSAGSGPCQYALPGVPPQPGIPICGPGGYVPPTLNPCDPGYEATSSGAFSTAQYPLPGSPTSGPPAYCAQENSTPGAGATQTGAPVTLTPPSAITRGKNLNITNPAGISRTTILPTGRAGNVRAPLIINRPAAGSAGSSIIYGSLPATGTTGLPAPVPAPSTSAPTNSTILKRPVVRR